jgi:hypothetical protein
VQKAFPVGTLALAACLPCGCGTRASYGGFGGDAGLSDAGTTITNGDASDSGLVFAGPDGGGFVTRDSGQADGAVPEDPATCEGAASSRSYVGCDFWPTVVFNPVWSVFDFAAVVANTGTTTAQVKTTRAGLTVDMTSVAPGAVGVVYLPWVPALKGADFNSCTSGSRPVGSVLVSGGAYHLTSTVPVTVWQFSPIEYVTGHGGPPNKNWACPYSPAPCNGNGVDCLSVNNGASLLLPSTAMTGTYRLFGMTSTTYGSNYPPDQDEDSPGAFAITATADGTHVTLNLVAGASLAPGSGIAATAGGGTLTLSMNAGDVAQLLDARGTTYGAPDSDLSGSLLASDHPVQVIAFNAITDVPSPLVSGGGWADHLEETVLPAESLGAHYLVVPPTAPAGGMSYGHHVRFYGNRSGTTLTYPSGNQPAGAPATLAAGQVVDLPGVVTEAFEVKGSAEFAVASMMLGGQMQDPGSNDPQGDPSLSFSVGVEQFRNKYVFLAPADYAETYADVVVPAGATVTLDGAPLSGVSSAIGSSGWSVVRTPLTSSGTGVQTGAHTITSSAPCGLQIMGFGHATSYYTPGGYDVHLIAPPPPSVQ